MYENEIDDVVAEALLKRYPDIFGQFLTVDGCIANALPEVLKKAEELFNKEYSELDFKSFIERWRNSRSIHIEQDEPQSESCSNLVFDAKKRKNVTIMAPRMKRNRTTEFDAHEFLKTRQENDSGCPIKFQSDLDLEADLEVLIEPQKDSVIDAGLRKIARAITVLNSSCNYRLLDVHSARVIR